MLHQQGRYRELIALADEIERLIGDARGAGGGIGLACPFAFTMMWRGIAYAFCGEPGRGRAEMDAAATLAREYGDYEVECWSHLLAGSSIADLTGSDPTEALEHARSGAELAERTGGPHARQASLWSLGVAHLLGGEWAQALAHLDHSLSIARERRVGVELEAVTHSYMAYAHLGVHEMDAAVQAAAESVAIASRRQTLGWELMGRIALARALRMRSGARPTAIEAELLRALELVDLTGAHGFEPRIRFELALLSDARGDRVRAEDEMRRAREQLGSMGMPALMEQAFEREVQAM
jgi:hypothetical protein